MKILFYGDSITDMGRNYNIQGELNNSFAFGTGYVNAVTSQLSFKNPLKYEVINTGISGNRSVDLYARIKKDCWNYSPDVISILIGVNDVWHEIYHQNGVEIDRFEKVYSAIIEDTLKKLPNVKFILCEPFYQMGTATKERFDDFMQTKDYAKVVRKLAEKYGLPFVELQKPLDDFAERFGNEKTLYDGVHPAIGGASVIADEWLKTFYEKIDK